MLAGCLALAMLVMRLFPETGVARALHKRLVEDLVEWVSRTERKHLIFGGITLLLAFSAGEVLLLAGSTDVLIAIAWGASTYVDLLVATWTLTAIAAARGAWASAKLTGARTRSFRRAGGQAACRREPRSARRARRSASNEDDPDGRRLRAA